MTTTAHDLHLCEQAFGLLTTRSNNPIAYELQDFFSHMVSDACELLLATRDELGGRTVAKAIIDDHTELHLEHVQDVLTPDRYENIRRLMQTSDEDRKFWCAWNTIRLTRSHSVHAEIIELCGHDPRSFLLQEIVSLGGCPAMFLATGLPGIAANILPAVKAEMENAVTAIETLRRQQCRSVAASMLLTQISPLPDVQQVLNSWHESLDGTPAEAILTKPRNSTFRRVLRVLPSLV